MDNDREEPLLVDILGTFRDSEYAYVVMTSYVSNCQEILLNEGVHSPVTAPMPTVERMLQMGFSLKEIQDSLSEYRYDEVCATYMLLSRFSHGSPVSPVFMHGRVSFGEL